VRKTIRLFLLFEGIAFITASLVHLGVLIHGQEHRPAGNAEGVICIVLLIGFVLSCILPGWTPGIGIAVQAFALLVGIYTVAIAVGPWTIPGYRLPCCHRNCFNIWAFRYHLGTKAAWS
jgi:hypothetical protein